MKITTKLPLLLLLSLTALNLSAQDIPKTSKPFQFLIAGGLEMGGDNVAEVYFTDGGSQSVKAGQGGNIAVGGQFQFPKAERVLLRATVGYKYVTTAADNVHIRLTRVPIHLTGNFMATSKLRLGAGLAMHRGINFNTGGLGPDMKFEGASGPIFEIAYSGIGISYTSMNYTDQDKNSYAASSVGLSFSIPLKKKNSKVLTKSVPSSSDI